MRRHAARLVDAYRHAMPCLNSGFIMPPTMQVETSRTDVRLCIVHNADGSRVLATAENAGQVCSAGSLHDLTEDGSAPSRFWYDGVWS